MFNVIFAFIKSYHDGKKTVILYFIFFIPSPINVFYTYKTFIFKLVMLSIQTYDSDSKVHFLTAYVCVSCVRACVRARITDMYIIIALNMNG